MTSAQPNARFWRLELRLADLPFLSDHQIQGEVILPGAFYVESALAAAQEVLGSVAIVLEDMVFIHPLLVPLQDALAVEVALTRSERGLWSFRFSSAPPGERACATVAPEWILHVTATLRIDMEVGLEAEPLAQIADRCGEEVAIDRFQEMQARWGMDIGPSFQGLQEIRRNGTEILGRIRLPHELREDAKMYRAHPALLDAALRALLVALPDTDGNDVRVLAYIERLRFFSQVGEEVWAHGMMEAEASVENRGRKARVQVLDGAGRARMSIEGIQIRPFVSVVGPRQNIADLLFTVQWEPGRLVRELRPVVAAGRWLLLCDEKGVGQRLRTRLVQHGADVLCAWAIGTRPPEEENAIEVDPASPADIAALVQSATRGATPLHGVVHMFGLQRAFEAELTLETLEEAQRLGCGSVLHLVQSLARLSFDGAPRLWLVTRGTQAADDSAFDVAVAQAPLWGLGRAIATEYPAFRCTLVDLDPTIPEGEEEHLTRELLTADEEEEIAWRGSRRWVGRFVKGRDSMAPNSGAPIRSDATYLITGGLGGLGLLTAQWLAAEGARHIVLMGRSGVSSPEQAEAIASLQASGVDVLVACADVAAPVQLDTVLQDIELRMPPLRGIVHAAGALADGLLEGQTFARFRQVFAPKVFGAWNLHRRTASKALDFFVLYSSMSALLAPPGVGNYIAANVFLDALAQHRRRRGLVATSIEWGLFAGRGMGLKAKGMQQGPYNGMRGFTPDEGAQAFAHTLRANWAQMGVAVLDIERMLEVFPRLANSSRFSSLARRSVHERTDKQGRQAILEALLHLPHSERLVRLDAFVRAQLAEILRMDPSKLEDRQPFQYYGFDSLMGLELRNRLQAALSVQLSMADIVTHTQSDTLAKILAERLDAAQRADTPDEKERADTTAPSTPRSNIVSGSWVVIPRPAPSARIRLICFPYAGGGAPVYAGWPEGLPPEIELCAIQPPGRHERFYEPLPQTMGEMVTALVPALLPYLDRPFATFGHCLGAIVMYEVLRELAAKHGLRPVHVFASGAPAPPRYLVASVAARSANELAELLRFIGFASTDVLKDADAERYLMPAVKADFEIAASYAHVPSPPLEVPITAFAGQQDPFAPPATVDDWRSHTTSRFSQIVFPGGHYFIAPERSAVLRIIGTELLFRLGTLDQPSGGGANSWLGFPLRRVAPRARIFCFPGLARGSAIFDDWASSLGEHVEVCTIELPGRQTRAHELPLGHLNEIVDHVIPAIAAYTHLPYAFFGIDLGALLVFEVTRQLRREKLRLPGHLVIGAAMAPHLHSFAPLHHLPFQDILAALRLLGVSTDERDSAEWAIRADCAALATYQFVEELPLDVPITAYVGNRDVFIPAAGVRAWSAQTTRSFFLHNLDATHDHIPRALDVTQLRDALITLEPAD